MSSSIQPFLSVRALVGLILSVVVSLFGFVGSASAGLVSVGSFSGPGSGDGLLSVPERAAVEQSSGNLFVVDSANDRVQVFAPDGDAGVYLTQFGGGVLDDPVGIAVSESGGQTVVYVSSRSNGGEVVRFESDEQPVPSFTVDGGYTSPAQGAGADQVTDFGSAIALAPNGDLWIADRGSNVVKRFDSSGAHVDGSNFDGSDSGSAFTGLLDIAVNSTGDVYVIDATGPIESGPDGTPSPSGFSLAERYTAAGGFVSILLPVGPSQRPATIAVDPLTGRVAVSGEQDAIYNNINPTVHLFDSNGIPLSEMTLPAPASYSTVSGMAFHATADRLYAIHDYGYWSDGGTYGSAPGIQALENIDAPAITIEAATDITTTTATLNATIDPNDTETTYRFEYKLDSAGNWTSTADQTLPAGADPVAVQATVEGLQPNRGYLYRVVASNVGGETTSDEQAFATDPVAPTVRAMSATAIKTDTAILQAKVNPHGQTTSYHFEWGTDTSYGSVTADADAGDGHQPTTVRAKITGLQPGATYHYRLVATNPTGATHGQDSPLTAAAVATADNCPNAAIRAQQNSTYLANCRAYEQVSPSDKNGYPVYWYRQGVSVGLTTASEDGNAAMFASWGSFAGSTSGMPTSYRSQRTAAGWTTSPVSPPPTTPNPDGFAGLIATWMQGSSDLTVGVLNTQDFFDPSDLNGDYDVYLSRVGSRPELVSRGNGEERQGVGSSAGGGFPRISSNGRTVAFASAAHLVPEDAGRLAAYDLYARRDGVTHLVNSAPGGGLASACGSALGEGAIDPVRNSLSADGSRVVFTVPHPGSSGDLSCSDPAQVYVRIDNERTLHVSASNRSVPDPAGTQPARFVGAASDGSALFVSSPEMLTDDAPSTGGVYRFDVAAEELTFVDGTGYEPLASGSFGMVTVSDDGSHVYFFSDEDLTPEAEADDGAYNLYASVEGELRWILAGSSALVNDLASPSARVRNAYATPDGEHLVFATTDRLTEAEHADADTGSPFRAVYLYSERDDSLICLSCDPAGQRPSGSEPSSDATISTNEPVARMIDDEGRHVVFATEDQLVPRDTNRKRDVYEFSDGRLSLISSGRSSDESLLVNISRDGRSVFFMTSHDLVGQDHDAGNRDLYVARVDGGFADQGPPPDQCADDACQGQVGLPPDRSLPGSTTLDGRGDATSPRLDRSIRLAGIGMVSKRALLRGGRLPIVVRVRGGGRVSLRITVAVKGKRRTVARARRLVASASPKTVRMALRVRGKAKRGLLSKARAVRIEARLPGASLATRKLSFTTGGGR